MAVYTKISKDELNDFLKNYEIGKITKFFGIKEGIENTTIVFARPGPDLERWAIEKMNKMLGLSPKLIPDDISGRRLHVLVWEGNKHYIQFRAQRSRSDPEQMARF